MNPYYTRVSAKETLEHFQNDKLAFTKIVRETNNKKDLFKLADKEAIEIPANITLRSKRSVIESHLIETAYPSEKEDYYINEIKKSKGASKMDIVLDVEQIEETEETEENQVVDYTNVLSAEKILDESLKQQQIDNANNQNGRLSIKQASYYLGVTIERVRGLIREKRVDSILVNINPNSPKVKRHMISLVSLDEYQANKGRKSGPKDRLIKLTPEQVEELNEFIKEKGWKTSIRPRYAKKQ